MVRFCIENCGQNADLVWAGCKKSDAWSTIYGINVFYTNANGIAVIVG